MVDPIRDGLEEVRHSLHFETAEQVVAWMAVAGVVLTAAATWFAILAARRTLEQLRVARRQLELAEQEIELARQAVADQREATRQAEKLGQERLSQERNAHQEQLRELKATNKAREDADARRIEIAVKRRRDQNDNELARARILEQTGRQQGEYALQQVEVLTQQQEDLLNALQELLRRSDAHQG